MSKIDDPALNFCLNEEPFVLNRDIPFGTIFYGSLYEDNVERLFLKTDNCEFDPDGKDHLIVGLEKNPRSGYFDLWDSAGMRIYNYRPVEGKLVVVDY